MIGQKSADKRGQLQISFGMIFSIIIIIATVATAFYVITYFLNLSACQKNGDFWISLEREINKAWNSDRTQAVYEGELQSGISKVCFGNFTQIPDAGDREIFKELERYEQSGRNAYLYPPGKACEGFEFRDLEHVDIERFFCAPVKFGKVSLKLSKTSLDPFAKLSRP